MMYVPAGVSTCPVTSPQPCESDHDLYSPSNITHLLIITHQTGRQEEGGGSSQSRDTELLNGSSW